MSVRVTSLGCIPKTNIILYIKYVSIKKKKKKKRRCLLLLQEV